MAAIPAGLRLSPQGHAYLKKAETEEKTKQMIEADDHVWSNEDAAADGKKYDYQTKKPAVAAPGTGAHAEHE